MASTTKIMAFMVGYNAYVRGLPMDPNKDSLFVPPARNQKALLERCWVAGWQCGCQTENEHDPEKAVAGAILDLTRWEGGTYEVI